MVLLESKVKSTENDSHRLFQIVPWQLGLPDTSPTVPQLYKRISKQEFSFQTKYPALRMYLLHHPSAGTNVENVLLFYLQLYSINLAGPKNSNWIFKRLTLVDPYLSLLLFIIYSNRSNTHNVNKKLTLPRLFEQTQCVSDKE